MATHLDTAGTRETTAECARCWDVNDATLCLLRTEDAVRVSGTGVAYCWRDGVIETGSAAPAGAMELARGCQCCLRAWLDKMAVPAMNGSYRMPGLLSAQDDETAVALLRSELRRFAGHAGGCRMNLALDVRFIFEG